MSASTTPQPEYVPDSFEMTPHASPGPMGHPAKARYRIAAGKARTLWPGPVGELVARELSIIEEFGWTLGAGAFGTKLLDAVEGAAVGTTTAAQSAVRGGFAARSGVKSP